MSAPPWITSAARDRVRIKEYFPINPVHARSLTKPWASYVLQCRADTIPTCIATDKSGCFYFWEADLCYIFVRQSTTFMCWNESNFETMPTNSKNPVLRTRFARDLSNTAASVCDKFRMELQDG